MKILVTGRGSTKTVDYGIEETTKTVNETVPLRGSTKTVNYLLEETTKTVN